MKLDVISYNAPGKYHDCRDTSGDVRRVDLILDWSLPDKTRKEPELLVGKSVEVGYIRPFILCPPGQQYIANGGVRIIEETEEGKHDE